MGTSALQILSYNVRYFGHALRGLASTRLSMRGIATALASLDPVPDLVCLQEIETRSIRARLARGGRADAPQLELFMMELEAAFAARGRAMPLEGFYFPAHVNWIGNVPVYTTGLAILVRMDRLLVATHNGEAPHRITYHRVERWKDRKQTRICAHMRLTLRDGRPLHVFNTHLSLPSPFMREFWQRRERMGWGPNQLHEARALAGFVRNLSGDEPFVVCGDFNSPPASPVYRFLVEEAGFAGAQERLGQIDAQRSRGFSTAGFLRLRMHLDHVFAGNGVDWLDVNGTCAFDDPKSPFSGLSDHVPLFARFRCAGRREAPAGGVPRRSPSG
jgi:endonuclease/exonuclease/phosphatase family metal-dependent hydrolase